MREHTLPSDIERSSLAMIGAELRERGIRLPEENAAVIRRVIHATADFDFAETMWFSDGAVRFGVEALGRGVSLVTDTNMARAGISRVGLAKLGGEVRCGMADPAVAEAAKKNGTTRAVAAMDAAAEEDPEAIRVIGNAPTALFRLAEQIEDGLRPALIIAAPVGFVNVVEGKERIRAACRRFGVPLIAAMGRKGGSTVAAAIANALIYAAADMTDPEKRGWN